MKDSLIMDLYRSGQCDSAFNEIVRAYSERLYWHVRRFTCCHEDTDDILQNIFIKVWKNLPNFKGDSSLFTWIYRIATNETLNFLRKSKFRAMLKAESLESIMDRKLDEDSYFCGNKIQREVQKAINQLPGKQKQVFILRYFEEMPYEDMSEILETSVGSLKASYHHASRKVKEYIENQSDINIE